MFLYSQPVVRGALMDYRQRREVSNFAAVCNNTVIDMGLIITSYAVVACALEETLAFAGRNMYKREGQEQEEDT
jgi:hypothetical protein